MDDRYVAGLFDGEGYIRINRWRKPNSTHVRYNLFTGVGMNHRPVIELLHQTFGGSLHQNRHDLRGPNNRIQFSWMCGSRLAYEFLLRIRPFVIVKKDEVELAIRFQEHIDANPYNSGNRHRFMEMRSELMAQRDEMYRQIAALKKRSYPPLLVDGPMAQ